jgi:hypothetical protein
VIAQIVLERDPVVALELGLITRAEGRDLLLAGLVDYIRDHAGDTPISETWHDDDLYRSVEEALFVSWR